MSRMPQHANFCHLGGYRCEFNWINYSYFAQNRCVFRNKWKMYSKLIQNMKNRANRRKLTVGNTASPLDLEIYVKIDEENPVRC